MASILCPHWHPLPERTLTNLKWFPQGRMFLASGDASYLKRVTALARSAESQLCSRAVA